MDRIYLKSMAKEQISGKIGVLFLCMLIVCAVSSVCSAIPVAGGIISLIISPVLSFGLILNFLQISRGKDADVKLMGAGFTSDKFGKVWLTYFLVELFTALWSLLFIIPGIVKAYSYMFAPYILADNPELTPRDAINKSKEMTEGYKMDLFILSLSFLGWYLLVAVTFGIAGIYVLPYTNTTIANAYNSLKGGNAEIYDDISGETPEENSGELTGDAIVEVEASSDFPSVDEDIMNVLTKDKKDD